MTERLAAFIIGCGPESSNLYGCLVSAHRKTQWDRFMNDTYRFFSFRWHPLLLHLGNFAEMQGIDLGQFFGMGDIVRVHRSVRLRLVSSGSLHEINKVTMRETHVSIYKSTSFTNNLDGYLHFVFLSSSVDSLFDILNIFI
jgi:hypothetical protein